MAEIDMLDANVMCTYVVKLEIKPKKINKVRETFTFSEIKIKFAL